LVDHDVYLLHLSKYIHRNPVDAHIVKRPEDYKWSSYTAYIGKHKPEKWLHQQEVYGQLQAKRQLKKKYQNYVNERGMDEKLEEFYSRERLNPIFRPRKYCPKNGLMFLHFFAKRVILLAR
jgi:putative transposase